MLMCMLSNYGSTRALYSVKIQLVSSIAAALERSHCVDANLITAISVDRTLVNVCERKKSINHFIYAQIVLKCDLTRAIYSVKI